MAEKKKSNFWQNWLRPLGATILVIIGAYSIALSFDDITETEKSNFLNVARSFPARLENMVFDIRNVRTFEKNRTAPGIAVVRIDDESLNKIGRWPWSRAVQAKLVDHLGAYGAQAVAFDVFFSEAESKEADGAFADAIRRFQSQNGRQVIVGYARTNSEEEALPNDEIPVEAYMSVVDGGTKDRHIHAFPAINRFNFVTPDILAAEPTIGFLDATPNVAGVFTHALLVGDINKNFLPSLGLALFKAVYKRSPTDKLLFSEDPRHTDGFLLTYQYENKDIIVPLNGMGGARVRYFGGENAFEGVAAHKILEDKDPANNEAMKALFGNKAVLVGSVATGAHDLRNTPVGVQMPGMFMHANVFNMFNSNYFYRAEDESMIPSFALLFIGIVLLIALSALFSGKDGKNKSSLFELLITVVVILVSISIDQIYFIPHGFFVRLFFCIATFALIFVWFNFLDVFRERQQKKKIREAFGQYVAPDIVKEMLANPDKLTLGGEKRELTMFFSDVRDFTSISEKLTAAQLASLLNQYMNHMTNILFRHKGTLDKYIGDAMVAFWNAPVENPKHAFLAVQAGLEMITDLPKLNEQFKAQNLPQINVGIGINTGEVSVGNMGSDLIFNFTALGDHMNLASRLEGLTKHYGANLMISEFTLQKLGKQADEFVIRPLDMVRVKGKEQPVKVFEVLPPWKTIATDPKSLLLYTEAYSEYLAQNFTSAAEKLNKILDIHHEDKASKLLKENCERNIAEPPLPNWDGVTTFTTK